LKIVIEKELNQWNGATMNRYFLIHILIYFAFLQKISGQHPTDSLLVISNDTTQAQQVDWNMISWHPHRGIKPIFNFDNRNSFLNTQFVTVFGARAGIELQKKVRLGVGFHWIPTELQASLNPQLLNRYFLQGERLQLYYASMYFEYIIASESRWEVSFPLQFGYGRTNMPLNLDIPNPFTFNAEFNNIWLFEPSLIGYYKIYPWMGLGAGAGYRHTLFAPNSIAQSFNAPVWLLRARFFLGELLRAFRRK
jgi:hypothetical protein